MKTIVLEQDALYARAAEEIVAVLRDKPDAVVAFAAGRTMQPLWKQLGEAVRQGGVSLAQVTFFQVAEFADVPEEQSLRRMTEEGLLAQTDLRPENCRWLTEEVLQADAEEAFDAQIQAAGGLDLAVMGIGDNAHIGFNEPGTQYDTRCRIQKLTDRTKAQYAWMFGSAELVAEKGYTMGIRTLVEARKLLVLATGEEKAKATFDMLYARDDSVIPAAFLQLPFDVTVLADVEAGKKL